MRKFFVLLLFCVTAVASEHPGTEEFVQKAVSEYGLPEADVRALLDEAEYKQSIIDAISRPAEGKPWHEYRQIFLTDKRIAEGVDFWLENRELIASASEKYGVDEEIIVAIIGVETFYGRITGSYRTIDALVTLGFYYPQNLSSDRSSFFSSELMHYMQLASEEGLPANEITGSYAGAMGMGQFMPSSYREYSVDFDGDGSRDLWRSTADVIGSVANYLHRHGWQRGQPVTSPASTGTGMTGLEESEPGEALQIVHLGHAGGTGGGKEEHHRFDTEKHQPIDEHARQVCPAATSDSFPFLRVSTKF